MTCACAPHHRHQWPSCAVANRGNTALALLLLVATNIIAVFTTPFLVQAALATRGGGSGHVSLQPASLLINLVVTILAPAVVGKVRAPKQPPVKSA